MSSSRWIQEILWTDGYFSPDRLGEKAKIYSARLDWPLITNVINGTCQQPRWARRTGESASPALFRALKPLVSQYGASWVYITDPDNALSVIHWERVIDPQYLNDSVLSEFETNRAVEGGVSYLVLAFHTKTGLLVFEVDNKLEISYYGEPEFRSKIFNALEMSEP